MRRTRALPMSGGEYHRSVGTKQTNTTAGSWRTWSGDHLDDTARRTRKLAEQRAVEDCDTVAPGNVE